MNKEDLADIGQLTLTIKEDDFISIDGAVEIRVRRRDSAREFSVTIRAPKCLQILRHKAPLDTPTEM